MYTAWLSDSRLPDDGLSDIVDISSLSDGCSNVPVQCEEFPQGNY